MGHEPVQSRPPLGLPLGSPDVGAPPDHHAHPEADEFRLARVAAAFRGFLESLGLDLSDPDLTGTARRVARSYRELLGGLARGAEPRLTTFPNTEGYAGIVSVTGIPFYSLCAHHFLPFFGVAHLGYVPSTRLVGLSKLARVADFYARRPQLQERLTEQIAGYLEQRVAPVGVIVSLEARHLCMEMRGVSRPGVTTTTTAVRGSFSDERLRQQFFTQLRGPAPESGRDKEAGYTPPPGACTTS